MDVPGVNKQRWVVLNVDPLTVDAVKALAAAKRWSVGHTLDTAVEYFSRKVNLYDGAPGKWDLPDDF